MLTDFWAHHFHDDPKAAEEVEDEDFNLADELARLEAEAEQAERASQNVDDWEDLES